MCIGWSRAGKGEGTAHSSMEPYNIWMQKESKAKRDTITIENATGFELELFSRPLEKVGYKIVPLCFGMEEYASPPFRGGLFVVFLNIALPPPSPLFSQVF